MKYISKKFSIMSSFLHLLFSFALLALIIALPISGQGNILFLVIPCILELDAFILCFALIETNKNGSIYVSVISYVLSAISLPLLFVTCDIEVEPVQKVLVVILDILLAICAIFAVVIALKQIKRRTNNSIANYIRESGLPESLSEQRDDVDIYSHIKRIDNCNGDFYDYFFVDDHHLVFYVAEISAKGIKGAILLNNIRSTIKEAANQGLDVVEIVKHANERLINDSLDGTLASIWIGLLDTTTGLLECVDAGHAVAYMRTNDGKFDYGTVKKNIMIGYSTATDFKKNVMTLVEGDGIFLYSKGIMNNQVTIGNMQAFKSKLNNTNFENSMQFTYEITKDNKFKDEIVSLVVRFMKKRTIKYETEVLGLSAFDKFGGINLDAYYDDFIKEGFEYSDTALVEANGHSMVINVVPDYRYLKAGSTGLVLWPDTSRKCVVCTFGGNFIKSMGIDENTTFPLKLTFTLHQRQGYYADYITHDLKRSNDRNDYPNLTDEEFANFRMVNTKNIAKDVLFRGSTAINPLINRNLYIDNALRKHEIKTIIDLEATLEKLQSYPNFKDSYYSTCDIRPVTIDANYETTKTQKDIASIMRIIASKETIAPYYMHCFEGQDRTGFLMGLIEAFMGASFKEIMEDFMRTYYNYYGVEKGNIRYAGMSMNLIKELEDAFQNDNLMEADLSELAHQYMLRIGLSEDEITDLYAKLSNQR